MSIIYLSLGSNLGNREQHLKDAIMYVQQNIGDILAESSIYESEAMNFEGNFFCNQVIKVQTALSPENLLQKIEKIEKKMGRLQKTFIEKGIPIYNNRIIDIDILLYDDWQIDTETLTIPHPRMNEREFVMKPLSEVRNEK